MPARCTNFQAASFEFLRLRYPTFFKMGDEIKRCRGFNHVPRGSLGHAQKGQNWAQRTHFVVNKTFFSFNLDFRVTLKIKLRYNVLEFNIRVDAKKVLFQTAALSTLANVDFFATDKGMLKNVVSGEFCFIPEAICVPPTRLSTPESGFRTSYSILFKIYKKKVRQNFEL